VVGKSVARGLICCAIAATQAMIAAAQPATAHLEDAAASLKAYRDTLVQLQEAVARQDGEAYNTLGTKSVELLSAARQSYEAGGAADSPDAEVIFNYAEVIRFGGDDDLGAEMVKKALDRGVESAALWRIYGEMSLAIGKPGYARGVEALQKSIALDAASPGVADAWFALGRHYLQREMPEAAGKAFAAGVAANPEHVPSKLGEVATKVCAGDIAGAGAALEQVGRAAQPHDLQLRFLVRTALADFDRSRQTFTDTADNHYAYARLLYAAARFPEAALAARRAAGLAKNRADIYNLAGAIQMQMGDLPGAIQSYEASLQINGEQAPIRQQVEALKEAQKAEEARQAPIGSGQGPLR